MFDKVVNLLQRQHVVSITGPAGCIVGDAEIILNRAGKGFRLPLSEVVRRFNGGVAGGRKWRTDIETYIQGLGNDNFGHQHLLEAAFYSGNKSVLKVKTDTGKTLRATPDHLFLTTNGTYIPLGDLEIGNSIISINKPNKNYQSVKLKYRQVELTNHPFAGSSIFETAHYKNGPLRIKTQRRVPYHRVVMEAYLSGLSTEDFLDRVRHKNHENLIFLDPKLIHVHHKDKNTLNNKIENLEIMTPEEHKHHHSDVTKVLWFPSEEKIVYLEKDGKEDTFDLSISNQYPHNFTANGIVVHNCGKTTLIQDAIQEFGQDNVILLAPTGKAARRISEVTNSSARTIHSAIYNPPPENAPDYFYYGRRQIGGQGKYIVVDETSMVDLKLYTDLLNAMKPGTKLIVLGDPNQLPPVMGKVWLNGDIKLTKIWRSNDAIISFAHAILATKNSIELKNLLFNSTFPEVYVWRPQDLMPTEWKIQTQAKGLSEMLITMSNKTRFRINASYRKRMAYSPNYLEQNETLLVRTNNLNFNCLNGEMIKYLDGEIDMDISDFSWACLYKDGTELEAYIVQEGIEWDGPEFRKKKIEYSNLWVDRIKNKNYIPKNELWENDVLDINFNYDQNKLYGPATKLLHTQHGYCLTAHSSQGSECDEVGIVWDSDWLFNNFNFAKAWWYTAISRAKRKVNIWKM